jgi:hypothetical protein
VSEREKAAEVLRHAESQLSCDLARFGRVPRAERRKGDALDGLARQPALLMALGRREERAPPRVGSALQETARQVRERRAQPGADPPRGLGEADDVEFVPLAHPRLERGLEAAQGAAGREDQAPAAPAELEGAGGASRGAPAGEARRDRPPDPSRPAAEDDGNHYFFGAAAERPPAATGLPV